MKTDDNGGLTKEIKDMKVNCKKLAMFYSLTLRIHMDYKNSRSCRVFLQSRFLDFETIREHPKATL